MADPAGNISTVRIRNGSLYLNLEIYQTYFKGLESVVLLRRGDNVFIVPVMHPGGGGLLIKIRNARGDRVIHAREFFRDQDLEESIDRVFPVNWNGEMAALEIGISSCANLELNSL